MQLSEGIENNKNIFYSQRLTLYNGSNLEHLCMLLGSSNFNAIPLCTDYNSKFVYTDFGLSQRDDGGFELMVQNNKKSCDMH